MTNRLSHLLPIALGLALCGIFATPALAKSVLPATQVAVTATTGDAVVIWDASVYINEMRQTKISDPKLLNQIQTTAGKLLIEKAQKFTPATKTVTVRVLYAPTQMAELYKTATFEGFEKLVNVSAPRTDAVAKSAAWLKALDANAVPAGMKVQPVGTLPKS